MEKAKIENAKEKIYIAIDLKSFYASVECIERGRDALTTNLVVADASRTEKTICLAVSPSLKEYGIPGRARLFEVVAKVKQVNAQRRNAIKEPYHFPEKLIPLMIANALNDKPLPVYGEGLNVRDWLYVEDHCKAIDLIIHKGRVGEVYNVGGHNEKRNIDIVKLICKELGKPESLIVHVGDRKGHDMRYAIDPTKIHNELGWLPETKFEDGIKKTIQWYLDNKEWWETIISGEYQNYYEKMYSNR